MRDFVHTDRRPFIQRVDRAVWDRPRQSPSIPAADLPLINPFADIEKTIRESCLRAALYGVGLGVAVGIAITVSSLRIAEFI